MDLLFMDATRHLSLPLPVKVELHTRGNAQGSQKKIAVESIDWRLHGKLDM